MAINDTVQQLRPKGLDLLSLFDFITIRVFFISLQYNKRLIN